MLSRDLIATVIKTFFEELEDVRDGGVHPEGDSPYAGLYLSYFNRERDWFVHASVDDITVFFAEDPVYKLEMLAELMYRETRYLSDRAIQIEMCHKVVRLYEEIDLRSMEFSMQRMNRVAELKELLK